MARLTLHSPLRLAPPPAVLGATLVWAAVAASAVYWGLKLVSPTRAVPAHAVTVGLAPASSGDPMRLLGSAPVVTAGPAAQPASSRFKLLGVVAPTWAAESSAGVATLSVDGGPARSYRVGSVVDGDTVVLGITQRGVQIGPRGGPASAVLALAALPPAAVGTRPNALAPTLPVNPGVPGSSMPAVGPSGLVSDNMPPIMMEPPAAGVRARVRAEQLAAPAASAASAPPPVQVQ